MHIRSTLIMHKLFLCGKQEPFIRSFIFVSSKQLLVCQSYDNIDVLRSNFCLLLENFVCEIYLFHFNENFSRTSRY